MNLSSLILIIVGILFISFPGRIFSLLFSGTSVVLFQNVKPDRIGAWLFRIIGIVIILVGISKF